MWGVIEEYKYIAGLQTRQATYTAAAVVASFSINKLHNAPFSLPRLWLVVFSLFPLPLDFQTACSLTDQEIRKTTSGIHIGHVCSLSIKRVLLGTSVTRKSVSGAAVCTMRSLKSVNAKQIVSWLSSELSDHGHVEALRECAEMTR